MKYDFLLKKDNQVLFNGEAMEIYIPKEYFANNKFAEFKGDKVNTLAIFDFVVYKTKDRKPSSGEYHELHLPMKTEFEFSNYFESDNILGSKKEKYYVFVLEKGNVLLDNIIKQKDVDNANIIINNFHAGHFNKNVPYDKLLEIVYLESTNLNGANLESAATMFEVMLSELCRSKNDETIPFRLIINSHPSISRLDYELISLKSLPAINSTFSALSFENINQSVLYSLNKTKNNEEEKESPLEKVITY